VDKAIGELERRERRAISEEDLVTVVVGRFIPLMLRGLAEALGEDRRVRVLATGLQDAALEHAVTRKMPSVVILDDAVEHSLLERLNASRQAPAVLVLAQDQPLLYRTMPLTAGAACIPQSASTKELMTAVHLAARGRHAPVSATGQRVEQSPLCKTDLLTDREIDILKYLSEDLSYARIARELHLAESTIKTHSARIRRKLCVKSKQELIGIAIPSRPYGKADETTRPASGSLVSSPQQKP
jgi:two-component system, NarL family, nitrate/nitrite response regulator NarL